MVFPDTWERRFGIAEWEPQSMTICIFAICESGRAIVTASDRKYGIGFTSAEFEEAKLMPLFKEGAIGQWSTAIAGTVSHATEVLGNLRRREGEIESREWYDIQGLLEKSYRAVRLSKIEGEILSARGWTLEKFQNQGAALLPPATYAAIDARMALYDLGAGLIVGGYGSDNLPCVMTVSNPGIVTDHSKIGFWCIGSGSTLAQTSLFSRDYSWEFPVEKAAYMVYEAKRIAERAEGVGDKETDLAVITPKKGGRIFPTAHPTFKEIFDELQPKAFREEHHEKLKNLPAFKQVRQSL